MLNDSALKRIETLHRLKQDGVITQEEFDTAKADILQGRDRAPTALAQSEVVDWIKRPLRHYADFNGRSRRKEFWLFQVIYVPITLVIMVLAGIGLFDLATVVLVVTVLGLFIPQLALQVRRFHDQDKSGWFALFNLIPYVGIIIVLIFMCLEGTRGDNPYGPDPKADE